MITLTPAECSVVELRQYTLKPGQRDVLIELFEREFVEPQEAAGMFLFGQFHDLTDPDRFVWLRGFADMESRAEALKAFYYGPVWQAHRDAANATMIDSDNVLLLRPLKPFEHRPSSRLLMTIADPGVPIDEHAIASFETEPAENTFPALPVRTDEVVVWFSPETENPRQVPADRRLLEPTPKSHLR
jgi:NIPSNAP protein